MQYFVKMEVSSNECESIELMKKALVIYRQMNGIGKFNAATIFRSYCIPDGECKYPMEMRGMKLGLAAQKYHVRGSFPLLLQMGITFLQYSKFEDIYIALRDYKRI